MQELVINQATWSDNGMPVFNSQEDLNMACPSTFVKVVPQGDLIRSKCPCGRGEDLDMAPPTINWEAAQANGSVPDRFDVGISNPQRRHSTEAEYGRPGYIPGFSDKRRDDTDMAPPSLTEEIREENEKRLAAKSSNSWQ